MWRVVIFGRPAVDPSAHTAYIVDPRSMWLRYGASLDPTARTREGVRIGLLLPARIADLLFGAVPGFVVTRYFFALVAIVPAYVLAKRCYGRPIGAATAALVLSSPVVLVAWSTDYANAAALSYLIAVFSCLGLALQASSRRGRLIGVAVAGVAAAAGLWSVVDAGVYAVAAFACYLAVLGVRSKRLPVWDLGVAFLAAAVTTGLLVVCSGLLFDQWAVISITWHSVVFLRQPSQTALWHSRNWRWLPYDSFLLVPPIIAVIGAGVLVRRRGAPPATLFLVVATATSIVLAALMQFALQIQALEEYEWSAMLWASALPLLGLVLGELARPLSDRRLARWSVLGAVAVVPLLYETDPHVPAFTWTPVGLVIALALVGIAVGARAVVPRLAGAPLRAIALAVAVVALAGGLLVLTVAPLQPHARIAGALPPWHPPYAAALGGNDTASLDWYRVTVRLPAFAGPPVHAGEQLLTWFPSAESHVLCGPIGVFHGLYNSVQGSFPRLSDKGQDWIATRHPGQILLLDTSGQGFSRAVHSLRHFRPSVVRRGVIRAGSAGVHAWLVDLRW